MKNFNRIISAIVFTLLVVCAASFATEQEKAYQPTWESLDSRPAPAWYDDGKFGIFIHWGVYSVPSWGPKMVYSEWYWHDLIEGIKPGGPMAKYMKNAPPSPTREFHNRVYGKDFKYQDFAPMFKAELFNPDEWAAIFARSGARYVVLTSKHHEGFCLWPSEYSWNWNSADVGPHRDLAGDLTKSVRAAGLKMGFYYSLYEWYNPQYLHRVDDYVSQHLIPQMKELVTKYSPSVLWTDGEWDYPAERWKSKEFLAWLYNESPSRADVVVNDRWGSDTRALHGGVLTSEYGSGAAAKGSGRKWEENQGMGRSFGYNRNESALNYKSSAELVGMLADVVSRGGNFLLDVGPTADGRIPELMQQRLLDIGAWLAVNGDAIYGTHPWRKASEGMDARYTAKGDDVYAICLKWPGKELALSAVTPGKTTVVTLLGYEGEVKWKAAKGGMVIEVPQIEPGALAAAPAWTFKITGAK